MIDFIKLKSYLNRKDDISTIKISSVSDSLSDKKAAAESFIPKGCVWGDLNFHKEYDKAIEEGKRI